MQRARRLASVAVVAAVAVIGLSACRSQPDVAAYSDAGNISVQRVQQVYDDAATKHDRDQARLAATGGAQPSPSGTTAPDKVALTGSDVLRTLLTHDVLVRLAQRHNVAIPPATALDQYAAVTRLPADSEYLRMLVETENLGVALAQSEPAGTLTAADTQDIYNTIKSQNAIAPGTTVEQFAGQLSAEGKKALGAAIAVRNEARDDLNKQHVRLNPRYQVSELPVLVQRGQDGSPLTLVATPVGRSGSSAPVEQVSAP